MNQRADGPLAKAIAALVLLSALGVIVSYHWRDLAADVARTDALSPAQQALQDCIAQRVGEVDQMVRDGVITEQQAGPFRARAQATCEGQAASR
ncbi:MAG: hypothetical protein ACFB3T_06945 [Geminicoccaceae bacterium]